MALLDWLTTPAWATRLEHHMEDLMATITEALTGWRNYTDALKAHITDLENALSAANDTATQLRETDAAEDAAQAQQLTEQIAQQISDALDLAMNPPAQPPDVSADPSSVDPSTDAALTGSGDLAADVGVPPTGGGIDPGNP